MTRPVSSLEPLEPRIAPANVAAALTGGMLVVQPIDPAGAVTVSLMQTAPEAFEVFDDGVSLGTFDEVTGLKVLGSTGEDSITLDLLDAAADRFRGDVSLSSRSGREDVVAVLAGQMAGDLRVKLGNEGKLSIADGAVVGGTLRVTSIGTVADAQLDGSFGVVVARGMEQLIFTGAEVAGDLRVAGDGAFNATVRLLGVTEVAGDVIFRAGNSPFAYFDVRSSTVHGAVSLTGTVRGFGCDVMDSSFGASFTMALGASSGGCNFFGSSVQGAVLVTGGGTSVGAGFSAGSFAGGAVTVISTGASISTGGVGIGDSIVAGKLKVLTSNGGSFVGVSDGSALFGGVTVRGTGGGSQAGAQFQSDATSILAGEVKLTVADGRSVCQIAEPGELRSLRFRSGDQPDLLEIGGTGSAFLVVDAVMGSGNDQVVFETDIFSAIRLNGGAGTDALNGADALTGPRVSIRSFELRD